MVMEPEYDPIIAGKLIESAESTGRQMRVSAAEFQEQLVAEGCSDIWHKMLDDRRELRISIGEIQREHARLRARHEALRSRYKVAVAAGLFFFACWLWNLASIVWGW